MFMIILSLKACSAHTYCICGTRRSIRKHMRSHSSYMEIQVVKCTRLFVKHTLYVLLVH